MDFLHHLSHLCFEGFYKMSKYLSSPTMIFTKKQFFPENIIAMNTDRILHISLICLGSLGMFLSVLAASPMWISPCSREVACLCIRGWCSSPMQHGVVGVVNFILSAIPVIIMLLQRRSLWTWLFPFCFLYLLSQIL